MNPGLLTKLRSAAICNSNLSHCYDKIKIEELIKSDIKPSTTKEKADIIEAIIGELSESLHKPENRHTQMIEGLITELLSFISYQVYLQLFNLLLFIKGRTSLF